MGTDFQQSFRYLYIDGDNDDDSSENANIINLLLGFRLVLSTFFLLAYSIFRGIQKLSNLFKTKQYMVDLGFKTANVQNSTSP